MLGKLLFIGLPHGPKPQLLNVHKEHMSQFIPSLEMRPTLVRGQVGKRTHFGIGSMKSKVQVLGDEANQNLIQTSKEDGCLLLNPDLTILL